MDITREADRLSWKNMFKKIEVPLGKESTYMYSPSDKCVVIATPAGQGQGGFTLECWSMKGFCTDKRQYTNYFQTLFLDEAQHVSVRYYSYAEGVWLAGKCLGNAGITAIREESKN